MFTHYNKFYLYMVWLRSMRRSQIGYMQVQKGMTDLKLDQQHAITKYA